MSWGQKTKIEIQHFQVYFQLVYIKTVISILFTQLAASQQYTITVQNSPFKLLIPLIIN